MISLFIVKLGITLFSTLLFFFCTFYILMLLDYRLGCKFKNSMETIKTNPLALSIYLAVRYASTVITMGMIVCLVFLT